ncbi:MAG: translesion error-prone DNA polymerase V autoproteolytic subunit [Prevotella sp.]|nr:translesion error-prone DNA polymerase V autoproteolytic subunit [Prevotella sp.]
MKLIKGKFDEELRLQLAPAIKAGFPSPAEDYATESLDFNRDLIRHPEATFYAMVDGDSMESIGICNGDIAVIDKSLEPQHGDVVVAFIDNEFNIKRLDMTHKKDGYIELKSTTPGYPSFRIDENNHFEVWGVVVYSIKKWRR